MENINYNTPQNINLTIAVDARYFLYPEFAETSSKKYILYVLKYMTKYYKNINFDLYFEAISDYTKVKEILSEEQFNYHHFDVTQKIKADLFFIPDYFTVSPIESTSLLKFLNDIPVFAFVSDLHYEYNKILQEHISYNDLCIYNGKKDLAKETNITFITPSQYTSDELSKLQIDKKNIVTIPLGSEHLDNRIRDKQEIQDVLNKHQISEPYLLFVNNNNFIPKFNYLLEAIICYKNNYNKEAPAIVITNDLKQQARSHFKKLLLDKNSKKIIFTDKVSEDELSCLYQGAIGLLHPALFETIGFGILEAMRNKCPVITNPEGSTIELGSTNFIYTDINNMSELSEAIYKLENSPESYKNMVENAYKRSFSFSWEKSVKQLINKCIEKIEEKKKQEKISTTIQNKKETQVEFNNNFLTVDIDARTLEGPKEKLRGIGVYSYNLIKAIAKKYNDIIINFYTDRNADLSFMKEAFQYPNVFYKEYDNFNDRMEGDLFFILDPMSSNCGYDSSFRYAYDHPISTIFYDLIPLIYMNQYLSKWFVKDRDVYLTKLLELKKLNVQNLAISETTKNDLIKHIGVDEQNIEVIGAGLNLADQNIGTNNLQFSEVKAKFNITSSYFLNIGALDKHKGFDLTFSTFIYYTQKLREKGITPPQLVIVGTMKDTGKQYYKEIIDNNNIENIVFTGYVSREEMELLYKNARALVFPSLYEGFGFPVLEAMANACPVITSANASIPEVGGDCVFYLKDNSLADYMEKLEILRTSDETREKMIKQGLERAKLFTWENVADKTVTAWKKLLNTNRSFSLGRVSNFS